jgi:hypothetical protein
MKHLFWLMIPLGVVLAVGLAVWQGFQPEQDPVVKLMDQKTACLDKAQTEYRASLCEAQFKDGILDWNAKQKAGR